MAWQVAYNRRDVILYALGVGADEQRFTYELGIADARNTPARTRQPPQRRADATG